MNYQSLESSDLLKGVVRSRPVCIGMELWKHCSLLSSYVGNEQTSRGNNPGQQSGATIIAANPNYLTALQGCLRACLKLKPCLRILIS
jgi:hypothetical protein